MGCGATKEEPKKAADPLDQVPADFPAGVEAKREFYKNWDESVLACRVLQCYPKDEAEIVKVANWAVGKKWTMRATGIKHNWSPITIEPQGATVDLDGVVLVNLMKYMTKVTVHPGKDGQAPYCVAQLGVKSLDFMTALENHKEGGTADIGYGLVHTPAPDSITLGGMLAIDGHGTAVPSEVEKPFNDPAKANFGTYSNRILAVRALVYDEATKAYAFKEFRRERGDEILPFLSHVGRSILSEATLQVEKNYYMRCKSILNVHWKKMFPTADDPKNPQPDSMAWHLKHSGRAEAIWFPFTEYPWLKVWTATDATKPADAKAVTNACNYPFSDNLGDDITELFRTVMGQAQDVKESQIQMALNKDKERMGNDHDKIPAHEKLKDFVTDLGNDIAQAGASLIGTPKLTPTLSKMVWLRVVTGLTTTGTWDLWGPSKNTLIYVKDTTLLVTANGYVVMTNEDNVQDCMYEFTQMYDKLLTKFQKEGKFPVSCPLEIRVTGVDDPTPIGNGTFATPPMSALCYDDDAKAHKWNRALWFDVLSLPNAPHSNEFYVEMEKMVRECAAFNGTKGRIRPEWSKGWGYSDKGPWKNQDFLDHTRKTLPRWNEMMAALDKHDPNKLFTNPWMSKFFVAVPGGKDKAAPVAAAAPAAAPAKADESQYDLRTKSAVIAARAPIGVKVEAGKTYYWCTCGKSKNQPFCDGSHQGSDFKPLAWTATESKDVYFCTCKQTKTAPFCDGSHTSLPAPAVAPAATEHSGLVAKDESQYDLRTKHAVIAARAPIGVKVEAGKTYYWCTCGKSKNQPFCDGSHQGSEFRPMAWTATESKDVYFCACKHTKNAPFCDGSHASLPAAAPADAAAAPAKADESQYDLRTKSAVIAARAPIGVKVEAGKTYYWCTCGKSKNQPFCDGSHQGSEFKPLAWTATEAKEVHFCACKHTKNAPFCDGSHAALPAAASAA